MNRLKDDANFIAAGNPNLMDFKFDQEFIIAEARIATSQLLRN